MNKYQEALDNLVKVSCPKKVSCTECNINKICNSTAKEHVDTLQQLVDKATPKKPIYKDDLFVSERYFFCAHCGSRLPKSYNFIDQMMYPYCPYCGGKQDWSDKI